MIRYPTQTSVITRLVRKRQPGWQAKADQRTADHLTTGKFIRKGETLPNGKKADEFWGEVKSAYITVQYGKCAYCETKLESGIGGKIQWDLEHFRPKANVREWHYHFPTGPAMPEGYYLLAYHLGNYLASCKICNSRYKSDYFPVAGARITRKQMPEEYVSEQAHLIYVLGDQSEDPQQYIEFDDIEAKAKNNSTRGQLIIDFLDLNREGLQLRRAEWLVYTVWNAFEGARDNKPKAIKTLEWLLSHKAPYTNCTQCFLELCLNNEAEAIRRYSKMERILKKF